jgi:hypothetical protein
MQNDKLFLGTNVDTKNAVFITDEQRSTHMQVIGSTGTGKSKFLEHLIREDIKAGNGCCLIDPHSYLYNDILKWLQAIDWPMDKIILFDPSDDRHTVAFNPLQVRGKDISFHVDAMVRASAKVWSENSDKTPLLKRCLRSILHVLTERGLTLLEGQYLASPTKRIAREFLTKDIRDPIIQEQWEYFNSPKMTPKLFYDEMGSTINRLMEFLAAERLRNVLGQVKCSLDFRALMDEGYVVLCNLSSGRSVSHDNAQLLGTLIVNDLFLAATERPPRSKPFYLYVDECGLFINEDIARILDEGRKFGLHLILAHQHLAQLKKAGEDVYHSVMTDAKTKVIFGGLSPEDAKVLAELMFLQEIDLDEYKHSLDRPTVVSYTTKWFKSFAEGEAFGTSQTDSYSESSGSGMTDGFSSADSGSYSIPNLFSAVSRGEMGADLVSMSAMRGFSSSFALQTSSGIASGQGTSHLTGKQEGTCEGLAPEMQTIPTTTYSLQDQIWKAMRTLVNQAQRHAVVKLPGIFTKRIMVPHVQELATSNDETVGHYIEQCNQVSCFTKPIEDARREIEDRRRKLLAAIAAYEMEKAADPTQHKMRKGKPPDKSGETPNETGKVDGQDVIDITPAPRQVRQKKQKPINS